MENELNIKNVDRIFILDERKLFSEYKLEGTTPVPLARKYKISTLVESVFKPSIPADAKNPVVNARSGNVNENPFTNIKTEYDSIYFFEFPYNFTKQLSEENNKKNSFVVEIILPMKSIHGEIEEYKQLIETLARMNDIGQKRYRWKKSQPTLQSNLKNVGNYIKKQASPLVNKTLEETYNDLDPMHLNQKIQQRKKMKLDRKKSNQIAHKKKKKVSKVKVYGAGVLLSMSLVLVAAHNYNNRPIHILTHDTLSSAHLLETENGKLEDPILLENPTLEQLLNYANMNDITMDEYAKALVKECKKQGISPKVALEKLDSFYPGASFSNYVEEDSKVK